MTQEDDDRKTIHELDKACRRMSLAELRRFCEGSLRAATTAQKVFHDRFPDAWRQFNDDVEAGRVTLTGSAT